MDPISQGVIGAALSSATARRKQLFSIACFGALAGMAPDLDVLIQSSSDPLLFLEFHRQFSHSLIFIPFGALLVALPLYRFTRHGLSWRESYLACLSGYATHGLLDACTSYGTQLLWPFSNLRIAWNNASIVDPLFTIPLLILVALAIRRQQRQYGVIAMAWALAYSAVGWIQQERAVATAAAVAQHRGHVPQRLAVKPSFGNVLLFKSIYEAEGFYYVDAVRVGLDDKWCQGTRVAKFDRDKSYPNLPRDTQQSLDIERFRWFSNDYLAQDSNGRIVDMRYSMVPNQIDAMWGISVNPQTPDQHVQWWAQRSLGKAEQSTFYDLLAGTNCFQKPRDTTP